MSNDTWKRKLKKGHVCIHIFQDDTVIITGKNGKPLTGDTKKGTLPGPINTYDQALWYNGSTCVWFRGQRY